MIRVLFKIQFQSAYQSLFPRNSTRAKKAGAGKFILIGLLALYVIASIEFSYGFIFYQIGAAFIPAGLSWVYFANAGLMALGISVALSVFMAQSLLFDARDNELLLSLPIKPFDILGSRLLALSMIDFVTGLLFLLPSAVIYIHLASPSPLFYLLFILGFALIILLELCLSTIVGFIVSSVTSRMRNKAFFTVIISLALLALYIWGYLSITTKVSQFVSNGASIGEAIQKFLPPFYYFGAMLADIDFVALFWMFIWCALPFGVVYILLSRSFIKIATTKRQAKKLVYHATVVDSKSPFSAMLRKETAKFLTSPMYLLNCGLAFLLNIIFGIFFFLKGPSILDTMIDEIPNISEYRIPAVIAILSFLAIMSFTTAPSISLEGKSLWILRSSPIPIKDVLNAKIAMNLMFGIPTLTFASLCVIVRMRLEPIYIVIMILLPWFIQTFIALTGIVSNLFFPKFDYINETVVVKQSASVLTSMLVSFALIGILVASYIFIFIDFPFYVMGLSAIGFLAILNFAAYRFVMTRGVRIFNNF